MFNMKSFTLLFQSPYLKLVIKRVFHKEMDLQWKETQSLCASGSHLASHADVLRLVTHSPHERLLNGQATSIHWWLAFALKDQILFC